MRTSIKLITLMFIIIFISGCFNKSNDALKFKEEHEILNGKAVENTDNFIRTLSIDKDNPFVYKTPKDIVELMKNEETFIVYFGFASCPWCRSVLPILTEVSKDLELDKIYYVNIFEIRSKLKFDDNNEIITEKEGTKEYYELLDLMDNVLNDYTLNDNNGNKVFMNEKRIYAPNIVSVVNGKAIKMESGISEYQTDAYMELTEEIKKDSYNRFENLIKSYNKETDR